MRTAIVHDYLTQRGGAERVVVALTRALPGVPVHTSLFEPELTFPELGDVEIVPSPLNRLRLLRRHHRLALPFLARTFSRTIVDADVAVCSSSGWAHGAHVTGAKIVYCHTPARWLYQSERYLGSTHGRAARAALALQRRSLVRWDTAAASSAALYLANSAAVRDRIFELYGRTAEIVPPPHGVDAAGEQEPVAALEPGFTLCVTRLLPYKNIDAVVEAFAGLPGRRLVVAGSGPDEQRLRASARDNVSILGRVSDAELRWLYASCTGLVAASYEDFGLTPLEAAAFGKPSAVLRWGGFLDTVREGETGVFFDEPAPVAIRAAIDRLDGEHWDEAALRRHADAFSEQRFRERIRAIVAEAGEAAPRTKGRAHAAA
jgi:glycosyltransferase involved in cell wall biosynthesis